jgi:hypothetical protein
LFGGVNDIWKHSEGVFRTPWRVYWYLFIFILVGSYGCFPISMQLLVYFIPSRALYLYCMIVCRVPVISIWRELKSWSRFAWYSHAFVDPPLVILRYLEFQSEDREVIFP